MRSNLSSPPLDLTVPAACALLLATGFAAVYSVSLPGDKNWIGRHMAFALAASVVALAMLRCPLSSLRRRILHLTVGTTVALAAVFLFEPAGGAQRWIRFGGFSFQPGELCKWTSLLVAAHYASRPHYQRRQSAFVRPVLLSLSLPLLLMACQPDFGSPALVAFAVLVILFLSGLSVRLMLILLALTCVLAVLMIWLEPYRVRRLTSFADPFIADGGYAQKQALVALAQGEWFGRGLERSVSKWEFLPAAHNDFIAAIIGEETGLFGLLLLFSLFALLAQRAIAIGNAAEARGEIFGALYAFGCAAMLSAQAGIHIGVNLALLPPKGLTLPLVSYGGSSLLVTGLMLGVLMRVDYENRSDSSPAGVQRRQI